MHIRGMALWLQSENATPEERLAKRNSIESRRTCRSWAPRDSNECCVHRPRRSGGADMYVYVGGQNVNLLVPVNQQDHERVQRETQYRNPSFP
jgi:hypothetical protein